MPEWQKVNSGEVKSAIIRKESLSPLSITIKALGETGNSLYLNNPKTWNKKLKKLRDIEWSKKNKVWENGIIVNGSVQLSRATQQEMVNIIKKTLMG